MISKCKDIDKTCKMMTNDTLVHRLNDYAA